MKPKAIIGIVIAMILIGTLLPLGLSDLVDYNGSYYNGTYGSGEVLGTNSTIATLVGTVVPVMAVIGLVMLFVPSRN